MTREIYDFASELVQRGDVSERIYDAIVARWGEVGAVELTAVVGYYSMVAMTLNVHRVPLPEGVSADLPREAGKLSQVIALTPSSGLLFDNRIAIGEVVGIHIDECVLQDGLVDVEALKPLGRMGYRDYTVPPRNFEMSRPVLE